MLAWAAVSDGSNFLTKSNKDFMADRKKKIFMLALLN